MTGPRARQVALFLDFDGTLVEIAPTPDGIRPTPDLQSLISRVQLALDGAVAIVSGRPISEIDAWLAPLRLPVAGQHGLELRLADDGEAKANRSLPELDPARLAASAFASSRPSILVEDKGLALAIHYREAPELAEAVHALTRDLVESSVGRLTRIPGKMVVELLPATGGKGRAIERMMAVAPFAGRTPVFLGDDVTDEAGFAVVNSLGGVAIRVGEGNQTVAGYRLHGVAAVHGWLDELAGAARNSTQEIIPWRPLTSA